MEIGTAGSIAGESEEKVSGSPCLIKPIVKYASCLLWILFLILACSQVVEMAKRAWLKRADTSLLASTATSSPPPTSQAQAAVTSPAESDWQSRILGRIEERVKGESIERERSEDGKLELKPIAELPPLKYSDPIKGDEGSWQRRFMVARQ